MVMAHVGLHSDKDAVYLLNVACAADSRSFLNAGAEAWTAMTTKLF